MNEPMIEIVLNGTNAAYQAGHITYNEAAELNRELMAAATTITFNPTQVTIQDADIGDSDCRKTVWDIRGPSIDVGGFSTYQRAVEYCREQGWEIVEPALY